MEYVFFFFFKGQEEQDDKENTEDQMPAIYSRRKLESNWDRYEESEKEQVNDDVPEQRGTDYHVLLTSAGKRRALDLLITLKRVSCCGATSEIMLSHQGIKTTAG